MSGRRTAATTPVLRRMTAEAVLGALVSSGELNANDLMTATGLSRPPSRQTGVPWRLSRTCPAWRRWTCGNPFSRT
jgi:hypothetical protein